MILVFVYDSQDNFVCTMNFISQYDLDDFMENASFDNPLTFQIVDFDNFSETLQGALLITNFISSLVIVSGKLPPMMVKYTKVPSGCCVTKMYCTRR